MLCLATFFRLQTPVDGYTVAPLPYRRIQGLIFSFEIPAERLDTYTCPVEECKPRTFISSCWEKSAVEFCHGQRQGKPHPASRLSTHFNISVLPSVWASSPARVSSLRSLPERYFIFPYGKIDLQHIHKAFQHNITTDILIHLPTYVPRSLQHIRCKEKRKGTQLWRTRSSRHSLKPGPSCQTAWWISCWWIACWKNFIACGTNKKSDQS